MNLLPFPSTVITTPYFKKSLYFSLSYIAVHATLKLYYFKCQVLYINGIASATCLFLFDVDLGGPSMLVTLTTADSHSQICGCLLYEYAPVNAVTRRWRRGVFPVYVSAR